MPRFFMVVLLLPQYIYNFCTIYNQKLQIDSFSWNREDNLFLTRFSFTNIDGAWAAFKCNILCPKSCIEISLWEKQSVIGGKLYSSHRTVFERAQGLWDYKTSDLKFLVWATFHERSIDHVSWQGVCIIFMCSITIISFRKVNGCIILIKVCKIFKKVLTSFCRNARVELLSEKPIIFYSLTLLVLLDVKLTILFKTSHKEQKH